MLFIIISNFEHKSLHKLQSCRQYSAILHLSNELPFCNLNISSGVISFFESFKKYSETLLSLKDSRL